MTSRKEPGILLRVAASRNVPGKHDLEELVSDLAALRGKGLDRATELDIPALRGCIAELIGQDAEDLQVHHLEIGLRRGTEAMGEGHAAECAEVLFGIASHVRGLSPIELRKRASELYYDSADRSSVDAFRKTHERRVLGSLGAALLRAIEGPITAPAALHRGSEAPRELPLMRLKIDQPEWRKRTLSVLRVEPERRGQLRELTWDEFGRGIGILRNQIHDYGTNLDIDLVIGINEAGLMMATLLASASFSRCALSYVRTRTRGTALTIDDHHTLLGPRLTSASAVVICDYEVKTAHVLSRVRDYLLDAGLPPDTPRYLAVMGALASEDSTLDADEEVVGLSRLACHPVLQAADLTDSFIACLMPSPGIDPPLGLR